MAIRVNAPTESQEQRALFEWAARMRGRWPMLAAMYHIPNEGYRSPVTGARMKAEGMRKGVPDICLPVARGGYHALYIELKRTVGGKLSDDQRAWIGLLNDAGNRAVVCKGWEEAAREIERYLGGRGTMSNFCPKDCPNRKPGCHSQCMTYAEATKMRREIAEARRREGVYADYQNTKKQVRRRKDIG